MIQPLGIVHAYWWLPMIGLFFAHFQWSRHLCNRLCSKTRRQPDPRLAGKTRWAIGSGMGLMIFYIGQLAFISWDNAAEAAIAWAAGYFMLVLLVGRNIHNLRLSRREYERILAQQPDNPPPASRK
jgi:hypothetical protein